MYSGDETFRKAKSRIGDRQQGVACSSASRPSAPGSGGSSACASASRRTGCPSRPRGCRRWSSGCSPRWRTASGPCCGGIRHPADGILAGPGPGPVPGRSRRRGSDRLADLRGDRLKGAHERVARPQGPGGNAEGLHELPLEQVDAAAMRLPVMMRKTTRTATAASPRSSSHSPATTDAMHASAAKPPTDDSTTEAGDFHPASTRRRSSRSPSVSLLLFRRAGRRAWYSSRQSCSVSVLRVSASISKPSRCWSCLAAPGVLDHPQQDADRPAGEDQHEDGDIIIVLNSCCGVMLLSRPNSLRQPGSLLRRRRPPAVASPPSRSSRLGGRTRRWNISGGISTPKALSRVRSLRPHAADLEVAVGVALLVHAPLVNWNRSCRQIDVAFHARDLADLHDLAARRRPGGPGGSAR